MDCFWEGYFPQEAHVLDPLNSFFCYILQPQIGFYRCHFLGIAYLLLGFGLPTSRILFAEIFLPNIVLHCKVLGPKILISGITFPIICKKMKRWFSKIFIPSNIQRWLFCFLTTREVKNIFLSKATLDRLKKIIGYLVSWRQYEECK